MRILLAEDEKRMAAALVALLKQEKYDVDADILVPFIVISSSIDIYNERWKEECQRRSEAGKKGNQIRWHSQGITKIADMDLDKDKYKEILEIKKIFLFDKGCFNVNREYERFVAHYEKSDWLDGNGVPITNKLACAKCWTPQYKDDVEKNNSLGFAKCWKSMYDLLADRENSALLITDIFSISFRNNKVYIYISHVLNDFLRANYDNNVEAILKSYGAAIVWNVNEPK